MHFEKSPSEQLCLFFHYSIFQKLRTPGSITKCYYSLRPPPRPQTSGRGQRVPRPEVTRPKPRPKFLLRSFNISASIPSSIPWQIRCFRLARIGLLRGFWLNSHMVSNHYHEQNKWLHFWAKLEQERRSRIRQNIRIDANRFAAISKWCWRLANEFTNFSAQITSSSAIAERPLDASCLVRFNSTIRRAQSSFISYFRFAFAAAHK